MSSFRNAIENLEGRQLMTTIKGTDIRNLTASDGTKNNGQEVIVKFDNEIKSANLANMRMFGYSNNTVLGGQTKTSINIKSVRVEGSTVVLTTDVSIRKGAQLTLSNGAVTDESDDAVTGTIRTTKGLNRDRFTLALRAFTPQDKSYFSSSNISGGATMATANTEPSAASVRTAFVSFLDKKVREKTITAAKRDATVARFDSTADRAKIPSANLRAAVLSLVGTVGEPAIAYYLDKANSTGRDLSQVAIGTGFSGAIPVAETEYTSTGRLKFSLNPNYAGESFVVLSGRMAHETLHEGIEEFQGMTNPGQVNSQDEEVIANFVETTIYAQQVVTDFTYAQKKTTLTGQANYRLLLLLNSGDRQFPRVGTATAPLKTSGGAAPGLTPTNGPTGVASFDADVRQEFIARGVADKIGTQTFSTGRAILKNITGTTYTNTTKHDDALIANVDIGQDTVGDAFAMRAARVIQVSV